MNANYRGHLGFLPQEILPLLVDKLEELCRERGHEIDPDTLRVTLNASSNDWLTIPLRIHTFGGTPSSLIRRAPRQLSGE